MLDFKEISYLVYTFIDTQIFEVGFKMVKIQYFTVDAFSQEPFSGNPAAVCLLEQESIECKLS